MTVETRHRTRVQLLAIPEVCWRCGQETRAIVGVKRLEDGRVIHYSQELGEAIHQCIPNWALREIGIGPLRPRRRGQLTDQLRNTCLHCSAVQGEMPLGDAFEAWFVDGGTLRDLEAVELNLRLGGLPAA